MKNFSIRKATNPNQARNAGASADVAGEFGQPGQPEVIQPKSAQMEGSLLTQEEQEALKPKDVKVENPWIYEQTHQEYLENIKVSSPSQYRLVAPHFDGG